MVTPADFNAAKRRITALERRATTLESGVEALESGLLVVESDVYTPTVAGLVIGTGGSAQNQAWYTFIGGAEVGEVGHLDLEGIIQFGTSGTTFPGATVTITLPDGFNFLNSISTVMPVGDAVALDADTSRGYPGPVLFNAVDKVRVVFQLSSGTYVETTATSTTVPFTWAINDVILWSAHLPCIRV
jgi:hypothetical protein